MRHHESRYRSYLLHACAGEDGAACWVVYEVTEYVVDGDADTETVSWDQNAGLAAAGVFATRREAVDFLLALCGGFDGMTIFRFPDRSPACR